MHPILWSLCLWPLLGSVALANALVTPDWLQARLADPAIQLIDVRDRDHYQLGHIAGAINIPVDETFGAGERADRLAAVSDITDLFSRSGVRDDRHLVLYDDGSFTSAARLFWVLEVFGQQRVSVLNIGYRAWHAGKRPVSTEPPTVPATEYIARIQPEYMATALTTRVAMDNPAVVIVDTRATDEYAGKRSIAKRHGHIPGAINIPWSVNLRGGPEGTQIAPLDQLSALYRKQLGDRKVIAYCNKGKQSALAYFVLRNLGYQVAAYDGSWFEWGNDPQLPIVNPQADAIRR
jgi:thiosulfate/3-mercaptopyruvate sulfurtransferase